MKFFSHYSFTSNPKMDVLSGLTVALALVPEAVAFSFVAEIDVLVGLYGAFMMGLITALIGGRPGMISGATGAMAVIMVHLVLKGNEVGKELATPIDNLGVQWLFITLLLVGALQILAGIFKIGKFIRLVPYPVMLGFVNGLAIVIFLSQLKLFTTVIDGQTQWLSGNNLWIMLILVGLTMLIMFVLPKITKKIPAALAAIIIVASITILGGLDVKTVGQFVLEGGGQGLKGSLPSFQFQIFSLFDSMNGYWDLVITSAFLLAAVGLIESLMTLSLIDEITDTRGHGNQECIAQGCANTVNGLFGGMGGCAMIGQSIININSGGRGRLSGLTAALALLGIILFAAPLIELIPIAALVGVMFMVVVGTFAWSSFRILHKIPLSDTLILVIVSAITVWQDLAIAVISGVIISALVFAWENAVKIRARKHIKEDGTKVYVIWGPLFFGSVQNFNSKFDVKNDPEKIEIDFIESRVSDHSGIEAIKNIVSKYNEKGKTVTLFHLSPECKVLLLKADPSLEKIIETAINDPRYYVVTNQKL